MRLPSSLTTPPPPRLRVPMKLHDEKMGQVQDDQSRTSDEEENRTTTRLICRGSSSSNNNSDNASQANDNIVRSERMGMKHAREFNFLGKMVKDESSILMDSTSSMPATENHTSIVNNNSQSRINADSGNNEAPTIRGKRGISKNVSAESETMESRHYDQQNEKADNPAVFSSSYSQINSSLFLRKVKRRTLWWSNRGSGYTNYYATLCLLFWMLACMNSGLKFTEAMTTNGETGAKVSTGITSHKISERSAAIVKLEPNYHPINFPKKDSHLEDNHLHSQQSFNDRQSNSQSSSDNAPRAEDDDRNQEELILDPTNLPEASRSTIIFQGIRNRTRVEVGPVNLFATKRRRIPEDGESDDNSSQQPGSNRKGRIMFPKSEALSEREDNSSLSSSTRNKKSEALLAATLSQSSEEGSSRKASPDVQDIIDGIVKLLGGKVHHPQPPGAAAIVPQVPFSQRQPQSPAYNLFNPNKPIYQTAKPSRINSRGPPLSAGAQNSATQTQQQQQQQQQPNNHHQSSFEAIPLEALNSEFKLNQSRFGPPFPLSQVVVAPEAPYKQGVPVPEQLVPPPSPNGNNNNVHNNGNFNLRQPLPPPTAPVHYVTTGTNVNNLGGNNDNRQNNGFYANGNNRYVNGNAPTQQRPGTVPTSSSSLPTTASNHNGNTGLTTVSTSLTATTNKGHYYQQHQTDNFNENGTRNPYSTTSHLNHNDSGITRKPTTTTVSSDEGSVAGNTALTTIPSHGQADKNRALSSPRPPPLSLTLPTGPEDDEEDDLRFTTNVDFDLGDRQNGIKWNESPAPDRLGNKKPGTQISLEPTISEESQLPSWSSESGRVGSSKETVFEFSELDPSSAVASFSNDPGSFIRPTSANTLYPTLVLETNTENGLVEIVTKLAAPPGGAIEHPQQVIPVLPTSTYQQHSTESTYASTPSNHQTPHPESNLRKQVQHFNTLLQTTKQSPAAESGFSTQSIHALPTPPLRKGIVINDEPPAGNDKKGYGSVEVVTVDEAGGDGKVGEIFDVTVTAKQSFGGKVTGQPFQVLDPNKDDVVITQPTGTEQFVSIDGKRTYFNLHPNTPTAIGSGGATKAVGHVLPVENTDVVSVEIAKHPKSTPSSSTISNKAQSSQNIGVGTVGNPVPLLPQPPGKTLFGMSSGSGSAPSRAVSTSLSISGSAGMSITGPSGSSGGKTLPNLIRRPHTRRPSIPPVRIDTCIVGDDTTCNADQGEVCRTESGVSSCVCRSGYARRRHREPCKAIVSLVLSIKLDKLGDKKLTYNPDYFNPNSELYQTLEWETIHAMDSAMGETTLSAGYVGSKLEAIGFDGRHAVVNTTVLIQENPKQASSQVKRDLQKQMIQVLTRNRNNFGKSQLWVEGPISAVAAITDLDECESPETNDCDAKAKCVNTLGSFECKCEPGYGDQFERDKRRSGRKCETCNGKAYCNGRGECMIENGQKVCKCAGNYYGSQCDIDGEVLAVAIGASVSAVVIIGLTLACLCMWSRKWKREEQKAALMSRTLFGGMATQALSYLGKNNTNPYQQHLSMDDRLRWAQCNDASMGGNIYVQNEPMSMHTSPQLIGTSMMETPPLMSARRSAETVDTTVDDLFDERQTKQRPRSRASQLQGSLYYDLEPEPKSDIYASRSMVQFPAQFCVPMGPMSHYAPPNRGYFP